MEDLCIDYREKISFDIENINILIKKLQENLESRIRNDFEFLCIMQNLRFQFCRSSSIDSLTNAYVKYSGGFILFYDIFKKYFRIKRQTVLNYLRVANKFLVEKDDTAGGIDNIIEYKYKFEFCKFLTISKLSELASLSDDEILTAYNNKHFTVSSTREEIRKLVFKYKSRDGNMEKNAIIDENDIPEGYDPKSRYDRKYFGSMGKSYLIDCILKLQEYCTTLENKQKKVKK